MFTLFFQILFFVFISTAFAKSPDISLDNWIGRWEGTATLYDLPQVPGEVQCVAEADFRWANKEHTIVEGTPVYTCEKDQVFKAFHRFTLNSKGSIDLIVNWGWGDLNFYSEGHGPWLNFIWKQHIAHPRQWFMGLVIQQMNITQFHQTDGTLEKIITVKLPFKKQRYLLKAKFKKIAKTE